MLVAAVNNVTNGVSNLSGHREMGAHVSCCVNNGSVHGFIVMVNWEKANFNRHARENGGHFLIVRDR